MLTKKYIEGIIIKIGKCLLNILGEEYVKTCKYQKRLYSW